MIFIAFSIELSNLTLISGVYLISTSSATLFLKNPFDFENMEAIVNKIISAGENNEKIFIYGDYDVDGISGTAFLTKFFNEIGLGYGNNL